MEVPVNAGGIRLAYRACALVAGLWLVFVSACAPASSARSPIVGTYLADNRPHELIYLDLVAVERSVTGAMTLVTMDEELGTQLDRFDMRGTGDGNTVTLAADRFLGRADTTVTVARTGNRLTIVLPTFTGETVSLPLRPTSAEELNGLVGVWSAEQETARRRRDGIADQEAAVTRHADELARALADVRTRTRRLRDLSAEARTALSEDEIKVQSLAGFVLQLKRDGAITESDPGLRCSATRARRLAGDRTSLESVFASERPRLAEAVERLDAELATGRRRVAVARDRMRLVDEARAVAPAVTVVAVQPGDDVRTLDAYEAGAETARRDLESFKASDQQFRSRSRDLVAEARAVLNEAPDPNAADCNPPPVPPEEEPPPEPAIVEFVPVEVIPYEPPFIPGPVDAEPVDPAPAEDE